MSFKHVLAKIVSILLLLNGAYGLISSTIQLVTVYPTMDLPQGQAGLLLQEGLIEKAIVMYVGLLVDGVYGLILLTKPPERLKTLHVVIGIVLLLFSILFVTETPLTGGHPAFFLIRGWFSK